MGHLGEQVRELASPVCAHGDDFVFRKRHPCTGPRGRAEPPSMGTGWLSQALSDFEGPRLMSVASS